MFLALDFISTFQFRNCLSKFMLIVICVLTRVCLVVWKVFFVGTCPLIVIYRSHAERPLVPTSDDFDSPSPSITFFRLFFRPTFLWHRWQTSKVIRKLLNWSSAKSRFKLPNVLMQSIYAGVPQGSVLGSLLFLIYINGLPVGLTSMCKIFADDTSLFWEMNDKSNSNAQLNSDLAKISKWVFQWKMSFNPDPNKQGIEVCFSNKRNKENCILTVQTSS